MAEKRDYYEVLGVSKDATAEEIQSAYRSLAKKYHPDLNHEPDAADKFKEVNEAYEVLKDPDKRRQYDQFGMAAFDQNGQAGYGGGNYNGYSQADMDDINDIFSSFFGGGRSSKRRNTAPQRGQDTKVQVKISFEQAVKGCKVDIPLHGVRTCSSCHGSGARSQNDIGTCPTCRGTGRVRTRSQTIFGVMEQESYCPDCQGTDKKVNFKCPTCHGSGRVEFDETITVNINKGVDDGDVIRVTGKGQAGLNGGPDGDLLIYIQVVPSKTFTRKGADTYITIPLSVTEALLGATVTVPTVNGDCDLTIPPCTEPNTVLKMAGQGITTPNGKTGSQYVTVSVKFPKSLNSEQKKLMEDFEKIEDKKGGVVGWLKRKAGGSNKKK